MTQEGIITGINDWIMHLPAVLLADKTTIKVSIRITPFQILYREKAMLLIELDIFI